MEDRTHPLSLPPRNLYPRLSCISWQQRGSTLSTHRFRTRYDNCTFARDQVLGNAPGIATDQIDNPPAKKIHPASSRWHISSSLPASRSLGESCFQKQLHGSSVICSAWASSSFISKNVNLRAAQICRSWNALFGSSYQVSISRLACSRSFSWRPGTFQGCDSRAFLSRVSEIPSRCSWWL